MKDNLDTIKAKLLQELENSLGNITIACNNAGIKSRQTFYNYLKDDPDFKEQVDNIQEIAIDYTESQLFNLIKDQNPTAILFYLKTKGKHRGYVEKQEIESKNTNLNIEKEITDETSEQDASRIYQEFMKNR